MERKYWIDNVKVFGIFLVVLGHFIPHYKDSLFASLIYQFHIPLFFIISGYLTKEYLTDMAGEIKKVTKRLLVPYFLLIFIGWGLEYMLIGTSCNWGGG